jgi:hypothetical protein
MAGDFSGVASPGICRHVNATLRMSKAARWRRQGEVRIPRHLDDALQRRKHTLAGVNLDTSTDSRRL